MNAYRRKVIACEVVIDAMRPYLSDCIATETLPMSLHVDPKALRDHLQQRIDESDGVFDPIVLGFGLCSLATVGLRASRSHLIIAKTDDCMGMFLGSREAYRKQLGHEPGTYFLTRGWARANNGTPFAEYERARDRWGTTRAKRLMKTLLRHYKRLVYINTPNTDADTEAHAYAQEVADEHALRYEEVEGKSSLVKKLILGPWDEMCVVIPPGQAVRLDQFIEGSNHNTKVIGRHDGC